jgi:hypothetical protein
MSLESVCHIWTLREQLLLCYFGTVLECSAPLLHALYYTSWTRLGLVKGTHDAFYDIAKGLLVSELTQRLGRGRLRNSENVLWGNRPRQTFVYNDSRVTLELWLPLPVWIAHLWIDGFSVVFCSSDQPQQCELRTVGQLRALLAEWADKAQKLMQIH